VFAGYGLGYRAALHRALATGGAGPVTVGLIIALSLWRARIPLEPVDWRLRRMTCAGIKGRIPSSHALRNEARLFSSWQKYFRGVRGEDPPAGSTRVSAAKSPQPSPNTRAKIVSTCFVWYPRSNFSLISSSDSAARTSSSASSSSRKSLRSSQTFIAFRCTSR